MRSSERIQVTTEKVTAREVYFKRGMPNFPRAAGTRSEVKKSKPLVTNRAYAGGAIGKTTKAAATSNAGSIEE